MAILALVGLWKDYRPLFMIPVSLLGIFHLSGAIFQVKLLQPTYAAVSFIGKILGKTITVIVFTAVYYLIFTPLAVLLRLCRKDVIAENSRRPAWIAIQDKNNDPRRITRLF